MNEVYIDTNVLLRYFLGDIPDQFEDAQNLIESIEKGEKIGFISILVINELIWIFEKYYLLKRGVYIPKILKLLLIEKVKIFEVKKDLVRKVLEKMQKRKFDFTDVYLASIAPSGQVISFDKDLKKIS